jgi:GNAT superfamily N-acetyltransferase
MRALIKRAARTVSIRSLRKERFSEELDILQDIFEDAWSENWGFVPFTKAEFKHLGQNLKHLVHTEYVQIAEVEGTPDAMIIGIPNVNEVIRDLNGRLLPLGWLKLLWRLKVVRPKTARVPLMGVRKRHHNSLLGAALAVMVVERVRRLGVKYGAKEVELSWILDDNKGMRNILESLGGVVYKRYRIFVKDLVSQ